MQRRRRGREPRGVRGGEGGEGSCERGNGGRLDNRVKREEKGINEKGRADGAV